MAGRRWTEAECDRLIALTRAGIPLADTAAALGRDYKAANKKLHTLGLTAHALRDQTYGTPALAALFGCDIRLIRAWIRRGLLDCHTTTQPTPGHQRAIYLRVAEDHLWAFLRSREAWAEWQPAQITDAAWRARAEDIRLHAAGDWLTVKEVARRLGYSLNPVRDWIQRGLLPGIATPNGWRVWSADLHGFVPPLDTYTPERRRQATALGIARKQAGL